VKERSPAGGSATASGQPGGERIGTWLRVHPTGPRAHGGSPAAGDWPARDPAAQAVADPSEPRLSPMSARISPVLGTAP